MDLLHEIQLYVPQPPGLPGNVISSNFQFRSALSVVVGTNIDLKATITDPALLQIDGSTGTRVYMLVQAYGLMLVGAEQENESRIAEILGYEYVHYQQGNDLVRLGFGPDNVSSVVDHAVSTSTDGNAAPTTSTVERVMRAGKLRKIAQPLQIDLENSTLELACTSAIGAFTGTPTAQLVLRGVAWDKGLGTPFKISDLSCVPAMDPKGKPTRRVVAMAQANSVNAINQVTM